MNSRLYMFYGNTTLATDFTPDTFGVKILRALLFFIPRANLDNEQFYPLVKKWCLELDDSGRPEREIGLDLNGQPLFCAPDKRNLGFWTDEDKTFQKNEVEIVSSQEFERLWKQVQNSKTA